MKNERPVLCDNEDDDDYDDDIRAIFPLWEFLDHCTRYADAIDAL